MVADPKVRCETMKLTSPQPLLPTVHIILFNVAFYLLNGGAGGPGGFIFHASSLIDWVSSYVIVIDVMIMDTTGSKTLELLSGHTPCTLECAYLQVNYQVLMHDCLQTQAP